MIWIPTIHETLHHYCHCLDDLELNKHQDNFQWPIQEPQPSNLEFFHSSTIWSQGSGHQPHPQSHVADLCQGFRVAQRRHRCPQRPGPRLRCLQCLRSRRGWRRRTEGCLGWHLLMWLRQWHRNQMIPVCTPTWGTVLEKNWSKSMTPNLWERF